jgi:2-polyprenyl-3-methyl-5-hydroxy-6-metoxy-1,4-benzoquinol methylase
MGLYRILQWLKVVPNLWMIRNPMKVHEFIEVVKGASLATHHSILDLGCGKGIQTQLLARRCRSAVGVDTAQRQIGEANRLLRHSPVEHKVSFLCTRLEDAGVAPSSLDRVFSFCVLEHIPNLDRVLAEIVRLLKPGGELHVSVDSLATVDDPRLLAKHKRDHHVVQYFTRESLKEQLQAAGLEVKEVFAILTSGFARREFEARIQQPVYLPGPIKRVRLYRRIRVEDERSQCRNGIMLVARGCRPTPDSGDH